MFNVTVREGELLDYGADRTIVASEGTAVRWAHKAVVGCVRRCTDVVWEYAVYNDWTSY